MSAHTLLIVRTLVVMRTVVIMRRLVIIRTLLIVLGLTACAAPARAQDEPARAPLNLVLGTVRTEAERAAVRVAVDYARRITADDLQLDGRRWMLMFAPEVSIETGEADAFNAVIAKVGGVFAVFDSILIASDDPAEPGVWTPDSRFFHTFPVAIGVEMNRDFSTASAMLEAGWLPWFQGAVPALLRTASVGAFFQGGYKFARADSIAVDAGSTDQSEERAGDALARVRGSARLSPSWIIDRRSGGGLGLVGGGDVWFDILNRATYYSLEATFRIRLSADRSFDFSWQRGSGAPNFNRGDQLSANLRVQF